MAISLREVQKLLTIDYASCTIFAKNKNSKYFSKKVAIYDYHKKTKKRDAFLNAVL